MSAAKDSGFTLIELMVALFIFGMLAAAGVSLLSFGVRAQAAATQRLEDIADLRRFSTLLASDLAQALPRIARGPDGQPVRAFTGNDGRSDRLVMGYVRSGWTNPEGVPRAGIQRVDVTLGEGRLTRTAYPMVDGSVAPAGVVLADRVEQLTMRYRDRKGEWRPRWENALLDTTPAAVEMTVQRKGEPPLVLAFVTGPTYP
ncbi:MAG: type II secretion system minor pseudopilin GspJ [Sphingomonas sp.]